MNAAQVFAVSALFLSPVLAAPAQALTSSAGHQYDMSCNSDGYVLRSTSPVSRFRGEGAATETLRRQETVYLGKSCDAFLADIGTGRWCWANGGIRVEVGNEVIGFPRQELFCPANDSLGMECIC